MRFINDRPDFNIMDTFKLFDEDLKGKITAGEIEVTLSNFDLFPGKHEVFLFVSESF